MTIADATALTPENRHFLQLCEEGHTIPELIKHTGWPKERVVYMRIQLRAKGFDIPDTRGNQKKRDEWADNAPLPPMTAIWVNLNGRLSFHPQRGYRLDGQYVSIVRVMQEAGLR